MEFQAGWYRFCERIATPVTGLIIENKMAVFIESQREYNYWSSKSNGPGVMVLVLTSDEFEDMLNSHLRVEEFEI